MLILSIKIFLFIILPVIISGFLSAAETAITAVSQSKIHKLKVDGDKRAKIVYELKSKKEDLISAVLIGNNAVNIAASSMTAGLFMTIFGDEGLIYASIFMTAIIIIFAELLPKNYTIKNAEKVALAIGPLLKITIKILHPITVVSKKIVDYIIEKSGLNKKSQIDISPKEELRGTIDYHHHKGVMKRIDKEMIDSVLDLAETSVGEIMIHRKSLVSFCISKPSEEVIALILNSGLTRVPVWEDDQDNIVGVVNIKDLIKALNENDNKFGNVDLKKIISEPWFVPENRLLSEQLAEFRDKKNHLAIVVDEYGTVIGAITLTDIVELIVGRIQDEHNHKNDIILNADGQYIVEGTVTVRDINRVLEINLPDNDAITIAGLLIYEAETIPDHGEIFNFYNLEFEVLEKENNQLTKLLITKK